MAEPVPGISAVPDESNARYFHVIVAGKLFRMHLLCYDHNTDYYHLSLGNKV